MPVLGQYFSFSWDLVENGRFEAFEFGILDDYGRQQIRAENQLYLQYYSNELIVRMSSDNIRGNGIYTEEDNWLAATDM